MQAMNLCRQCYCVLYEVRSLLQDVYTNDLSSCSRLIHAHSVTSPSAGQAQFAHLEMLSSQCRQSFMCCRYLVEVGQVATVPGDAFGAPDCIRISYAASMADLEKAMERLSTALSKVKSG